MTLQDWSNLAQVIGALAVVISLFYVGFQIKRNTSAVRSATAQAIHNNYGDWYMNLMGDAELNRIALKGLRDYSSLDEIEKAQFIHTFMAFISFSQMGKHRPDPAMPFRPARGPEFAEGHPTRLRQAAPTPRFTF